MLCNSFFQSAHLQIRHQSYPGCNCGNGNVANDRQSKQLKYDNPKTGCNPEGIKYDNESHTVFSAGIAKSFTHYKRRESNEKNADGPECLWLRNIKKTRCHVAKSYEQ